MSSEDNDTKSRPASRPVTRGVPDDPPEITKGYGPIDRLESEETISEPYAPRLSRRGHRLIEALFDERVEEGYVARVLAQVGLPHTDPRLKPGEIFSRTTGLVTVSLVPAGKDVGIPYGPFARLILAWMCTEAVRKKSPLLVLGDSLHAFVSQKLGLRRCGGSDYEAIREQFVRLARTAFVVVRAPRRTRKGVIHSSIDQIFPVTKIRLWWHEDPMVATLTPAPPVPEYVWDDPFAATTTMDKTLMLSEEFFREITRSPVPVRLDHYRALMKSPLAMDLYTWIGYRLYVMDRLAEPRIVKRPPPRGILIGWDDLRNQLGAQYAPTPMGTRDFRKKLRKRLAEALLYLPDAADRVFVDEAGLHLRPAKKEPRKGG